MKRIVLWLLSTVTVVVLLFGYRTSTAGNLALGGLPTPISSTVAPSASGTAKGGAGSSSSASGGSSGGGSSSGGSSSSGTKKAPVMSTSTVTGSVISTQWGPVQVQLSLKGNAITGVTVLQYPSGNSRDGEINSYALPILIDETTQAQSAQIDMVSGATVTSTGYVQSLQSALDQAGA